MQLVLGLAGVLIILRPGLGAFHPAALVMLLGSLCYAGNMIFTKRLSATDSRARGDLLDVGGADADHA